MVGTRLLWVGLDTQSVVAEPAFFSHNQMLVPKVSAIRIKHQKIGENHPMSHLLNDFAQLYDHKAQYAEAELLMRRSLEIDEKSLGEDHPNLAIRLNNLAQLLQETNPSVRGGAVDASRYRDLPRFRKGNWT